MEKTSIKRLGYGFSALVMSLSAVNFMPAFSNSAYAETVTTTTVDAADDLTGAGTKGSTIHLAKGITIDSTIAIKKNLTIFLDSNSLELGEAAIAFSIAKNCTLTIEGQGDLTSFNKLSTFKAGEGSLVLKGGTYSVDVKDFVDNNYAAYEIADGKWEVAEKNTYNNKLSKTFKGGEEFTTSIVNTDEIKYEGTKFTTAVAKLGKVEQQEGFSFNLETGEVTVADSVVAGTYTIAVTDNAGNTSTSTLKIYTLGEATSQSAKVNENFTLENPNIFKEAKTLPNVTYEVVDKENSSITSKTTFKATQTGVFKVKYTISDTNKTTGEFDVVVSHGHGFYSTTEIFQNLNKECGDQCIINTDSNFEAVLDEESSKDAAKYVQISQDDENDKSKLTIKLNDPFYSTRDDAIFFYAGNSKNRITLSTYRVTEEIDVMAGEIVNLSDIYSVYGEFLTNASSANGTFGGEGITTITNSKNKSIDGTNAKKDGAYYKAGTKNDTITWTFANSKEDTTTVNVHTVQQNNIPNQYKSIDEVKINDLISLYNKAGKNSEVTLLVDGEEVNEDSTFTVGRHDLKYVEKVGDKVVSDDVTAYLYVTGIEVPEAREIEVGEEAEIDLTDEGKIAYGIDLDNIEAVNTVGLKVNGSDGKYTVSAEKEGTYKLTFTTKEKTAEDTYKGSGTYTFTFNVKPAEEEPEQPIEYTLDVKPSKDESDEVKIDEEITFTWKSNGTLLVSIDGGEAKEDETSAESDGGAFTATFDTAGKYTVTVSLKEDPSKTQTFTFNVVEDKPEVKTAKFSVEPTEATEIEVGGKVNFTINVESLANPEDKVTVSVNGGEAETTDNKTYIFDATDKEAGNYELVFSLEGAENVTKTIVVVAAEEPEHPAETDPKPETLEAKTSTVLVSLDEVENKEFTIESSHSIKKVACLYDSESCSESDIKFEFGDHNYKFISLTKAGVYTLNFYHRFSDQEERTLIETVNVVVYDIAADDEEKANKTLSDIVSKLAEVAKEIPAGLSNADKAAAIAEKLEQLSDIAEKVGGDNKAEALTNIVAAISKGKTLTTEVTGANEAIAENEVAKTDKEAILSALDEAGVSDANISYYDINVVVKADEEKIASLSELGKGVKIAIAIEQSADGKARSYYVVRYHDGEAEILESGVSEDGKTITFTSDKFSTYAVAYTEEEGTDPADDPTDPADPTTDPTDDPAGPTTDPTDDPADPTADPTEDPAVEPTKPVAGEIVKGGTTVKTPDTGVATAGISSATASAIISSLVTASLIALVGAVKFAKRNK